MDEEAARNNPVIDGSKNANESSINKEATSIVASNEVHDVMNPNFVELKPSVISKFKVKRCEFKGCKKTSNDCHIVNHSCPEHHDLMKKGQMKKGTKIIKKIRL